MTANTADRTIRTLAIISGAICLCAAIGATFVYVAVLWFGKQTWLGHDTLDRFVLGALLFPLLALGLVGNVTAWRAWAWRQPPSVREVGLLVGVVACTIGAAALGLLLLFAGGWAAINSDWFLMTTVATLPVVIGVMDRSSRRLVIDSSITEPPMTIKPVEVGWLCVGMWTVTFVPIILRVQAWLTTNDPVRSLPALAGFVASVLLYYVIFLAMRSVLCDRFAHADDATIQPKPD